MAKAVLAKITQKINGIELVEATKVNINKKRPLARKKTSAGKILTGKGIGETDLTIEFANPSDRMQFEFFAEAIEGEEGFQYDFIMGAASFQVPNCFIGDGSASYDPGSGDLSRSVNILGGVMKKIT